MKAGIFFTGSGPLLILTTFNSLEDPKLVQMLSAKGIYKFIVHEVSLEKVKERYGTMFDMVMGDVRQTDDLRVLDYNGHHIYGIFPFREFGTPIYHEA